MKLKLAFLASAVGLLVVGTAQSATVTYAVDDVRSADGVVRGRLCADAARFPGGDCPYAAESSAQAGSIRLVFKDVAPGRYAFSVFHDANANGRLDMPTEGFAFGNDAGFPPRFEAAAIAVRGDTDAKVHMNYLTRRAETAQAPSMGETGAAAPSGVVKIDLRADGLYGALYAPAGARNLPVIIALGGSEGGLDAISNLTVGFTRRGYAVLALAYWRAPGLPQTLEAVPLEYFVRAVDWAKARPEIDPRRVGVLGWSRGAEAALLLASHDADVKAVIALAPTANVWPGLNPARMAGADAAWTFGGRPLPALVPVGGPGTTSLKDLFVHGLDHAGEHPETVIPVEKINGPVLMLTGADDPIWPSSRMAEQAMARLDERGFPFDHRHVDYPDAGHLVFAAEGADLRRISPTARAMLGGSESANAAARSASWPLALDFADQALKGKAR